ncbi:MAG TPA: cytochrome c3 family protein [Anaeromyxobacteraceae bacterium]|nr:cytochrome c3 family protein [Anaeromyxobacteraceae bacterium]
MKTLLWPALTAALALAAARPARASDAPHDGSSGFGCTDCHMLHNAKGSALTSTAANYTLCASCHTNPQRFGWPWATSDQATPGGGGDSHHWSALARTSDPGAAEHGAQTPAAAGMAQVLSTNGGTLSCSVCHDQHSGASKVAAQGGAAMATQNVSPVTKTSAAGTVAVASVGATATPRGYLLRFSTATAYKISHDNGVSWFFWNGTAWAADATGTGAGKAVVLSTPQPLTDATVLVTFTGAFAANDTFKFYVSYPFLRVEAAMTSANDLCESCHVQRVVSELNSEGVPGAPLGAVTLGTTVFSHPVGEALNHAYDRKGASTQGAILDASGVPQATGDGNRTNDLRLFGPSGDTVRCLSCHYPHQQPSNSLYVHQR